MRRLRRKKLTTPNPPRVPQNASILATPNLRRSALNSVVAKHVDVYLISNRLREREEMTSSIRPAEKISSNLRELTQRNTQQILQNISPENLSSTSQKLKWH
mmetsp:Transcript_14187/g.31020  ORF Transcript_14187/g.31020 Transcript_14187/m.31020 type:complete len:102 (+) Transcript_14187:354-659(+)